MVQAEKTKFTVAILGSGSRGAESYGRLFLEMQDKYEIVSLCDISSATLQKYQKIFNVPQESCFLTEEEFFKARRADLLVIATLDKDHVRQCLAGLQAGYDILMEKPISDSKEECLQLLEAQKKYGGKVFVCHVLRYAPAFMKVGELLKEGAIGKLVSIQAIEQVAYWHQSHSYVRGNWRREEDTTPMILAKCCHDLDLLQFYADSACVSVSSVGELTYFKKENAPEGTATRCMECKDKDTCPYSAKRIYLELFEAWGSPENSWPFSVLTPVIPLTKEAILKAVQEGPYGRCVFHCDNDVVDHQFVQMTFANGVKASLLMTGFTAGSGRIMKFYGTTGEIVFDEERGVIEVKPFGSPANVIAVNTLGEKGYSHGGGDYGLISALYEILRSENSTATSLAASIESHLIGICAEESRKAGGKLVRVHED